MELEEVIWTKEIAAFCRISENVKKVSRNTVMSYHGDLGKMTAYMKNQGVCSVDEISATLLNSFVLNMECTGKSAATISRYIASIKAFFEYLMREHVLERRSVFLSESSESGKKKYRAS